MSSGARLQRESSIDTAIGRLQYTDHWQIWRTNTERIFRWPESTGVVSSFDRVIPAWSLTNRGSSSCPTGDGQNWCLRTDQRILAGVLSWNHLTTQAELTWFWNVRQGGAFPRPYVNAAKFRESDLAFLGSPLIWHPDGVWHYVAGAANARGDTGLHIGYGFGPNFFPSTAACVDDDFNGVPPGWECVGTRAGTAGPANNGWGDYFAVRPASPSNNGWFATGFTQQGGKFGANVEPRAMVFGRDRDFQQFYRWFTK